MSSAAPPVVLVLTTIAADADGLALARTLVGEHLAACVNVLPPMASVYRWKGQVEQDREQQLVIKTTSDRVAALEARIRQLHAYELPEFLVVQADGGSAAYVEWVRAQVSSPRGVRADAARTRRPSAAARAPRSRSRRGKSSP